MQKAYKVFCLVSEGRKYYSVFRYGQNLSNGKRDKIFVTPFLSSPKLIRNYCDYCNVLHDCVVSICNCALDSDSNKN